MRPPVFYMYDVPSSFCLYATSLYDVRTTYVIRYTFSYDLCRRRRRRRLDGRRGDRVESELRIPSAHSAILFSESSKVNRYVFIRRQNSVQWTTPTTSDSVSLISGYSMFSLRYINSTLAVNKLKRYNNILPVPYLKTPLCHLFKLASQNVTRMINFRKPVMVLLTPLCKVI